MADTPLHPTFAVTAIALALGSAPVGAAEPLDVKDVEFFETKIRPLLVKHCYACHSSHSDTIEGGLRLDSQPGWQKGGDSGQVIVPGAAP